MTCGDTHNFYRHLFDEAILQESSSVLRGEFGISTSNVCHRSFRMARVISREFLGAPFGRVDVPRRILIVVQTRVPIPR